MEDQQGALFRIRLQGGRLSLESVLNCPAPPPTAPPSDMLPDGEVTRGLSGIDSAWLAAPTRRYKHAMLGDDIEAGELRVRLNSGLVLKYPLELGDVFEDRIARIVDLGSDGEPELLVVRSGLQTGSSLALFGVDQGRLNLIAQSEPLGMPLRWLNPVGVGDFDGDGIDEIAAVLTPHIGGVLTLYHREGARLVPYLKAERFSNHAPGSRELGMSAVLDADGNGVPDLAIPSANRKDLRIVTFASGQFRELDVIENVREIVSGVYVLDVDGDGLQDLIYALEDGRIVLLRHN